MVDASFESEAIAGQDHWADRLDATGYFATDYFKIDPKFGDLATAKTLVEEAHKRGLYVFLMAYLATIRMV